MSLVAAILALVPGGADDRVSRTCARRRRSRRCVKAIAEAAAADEALVAFYRDRDFRGRLDRDRRPPDRHANALCGALRGRRRRTGCRCGRYDTEGAPGVSGPQPTRYLRRTGRM